MEEEWDTTWNCQSGRLTNEDITLPWEEDDDFFSEAGGI